MGDNIIAGIKLGLIGMGVVFLVLYLLVLILKLSKVISTLEERRGEEVSKETIAIIVATVATYLDKRPDQFVVKSIRKVRATSI